MTVDEVDTKERMAALVATVNHDDVNYDVDPEVEPYTGQCIFIDQDGFDSAQADGWLDVEGHYAVRQPNAQWRYEWGNEIHYAFSPDGVGAIWYTDSTFTAVAD